MSVFDPNVFDPQVFDAGETAALDGGAIITTGANLTGITPSTGVKLESGSVLWTGAGITGSDGFRLEANAGAIVLTGAAANLTFGTTLTANPGSITLTGAAANLSLGYRLTALPGSITLRGQEVELLAPESEEYFLDIIIDLFPVRNANQYEYNESLTVDGVELKVKSWNFDEDANSSSGRLQIELWNVEQRSLINQDSDIDFLFYDNGQWKRLLSTGYLNKKDYGITRQGIGAAKTFTFSALSEMTAKLNRVPSNNLIIYNPARHNVTVDDFEGFFDKDGDYTAPELLPITDFDFYSLLEEVADRCGFTGAETNIPNFTLGLVQFEAGKPFVATLNGLIGMFEADYDEVDGKLWVRNGISGVPAGFPTPRRVTCSQAESLGVSSDIQRIDSLQILVSQERFTFDSYQSRTVTTVANTGDQNPFPDKYKEIETQTTFRDFYRNSRPTKPVKSEILSIRKETTYLGTIRTNLTIEDFTLDGMGRVKRRYKQTMALIPVRTTATFWDFLTTPRAQPVDTQTSGNTTTNTYANGTTETTVRNEDGSSSTTVENANGDRTVYQYDENGNQTSEETTISTETSTLRYVFVRVAEEEENIVYKAHPYEPGQYYIKEREINKAGLIFIDSDNQQLEIDYEQEAMRVYEGGNVQENLSADWVKIETFKEEISPQRGKKVKIRTTETSYLNPPPYGTTQDFEEIRDGEVGVNIFVVEQQKVYLFADGADEINGFTDSVNMGELPMNIAIATGEQILRNQGLSNTVNFALVNPDTTLQKGTPVNPRDLDGSDLGNYVIEGRSIGARREGTAKRYFMNIICREV